jgi:hypothetical protein
MTVAATITAAVAAGGGLGGLAALISALRTPSPVQPSSQAGHPPPAGRRPQTPAPAGLRVSWAAFLPLVLGTCACVLAGTLVALVGATTISLSQVVVVALVMGTAAFAAPAVWVSTRLVWHGIGQGRPDLALFGGAGLVLAAAAVAAALIAGTG